MYIYIHASIAVNEMHACNVYTCTCLENCITGRDQFRLIEVHVHVETLCTLNMFKGGKMVMYRIHTQHQSTICTPNSVHLDHRHEHGVGI